MFCRFVNYAKNKTAYVNLSYRSETKKTFGPSPLKWFKEISEINTLKLKKIDFLFKFV